MNLLLCFGIKGQQCYASNYIGFVELVLQGLVIKQSNIEL